MQLNRGNSAWADIATDERNDVVHRGARLEHGGNAGLLQILNIHVGNDAADQQEHVVHFVLLQKVVHARHDGVMSTAEDRQSDDIDVFLKSGSNNHFGCLTQTGVNDFHACIPESACDYFRATVVAVQARL